MLVNSPFNSQSILSSVKDCHRLYNTDLVIHDGLVSDSLKTQIPSEIEIIDITKLESPESLPRSSNIILYIAQWDDLGIPFVQKIIERGDKYVAPGFAPRGFLGSYKSIHDNALKESLRQKELGFSKWNTPDFENLIQAVKNTAHIPGCYLEVGCYRGSSAGAVLSYARSHKIEGNYVFLDVFDGFDYDEAEKSADTRWKDTHETEGYEIVKERIESYKNNDCKINIQVFKSNIITDKLPDVVSNGGIRVANLDVDLYDAVDKGLQILAPHINVGGILFCEDAGHTPALIGARVAVENFSNSEASNSFTRFDLASGQVAFFKHC